ncbi:MAG: hypothetical protein KatS3mg094_154 [Candidatus Parcubacteria bacterium]|nr:MAG: hypothetical protein KatS3mg094_154 [Candidatus Parcubacteria bacterium]
METKKEETKKEEGRVRKYKLLLDRESITGVGLEKETGKYVYVPYEKDNKYYLQLNDKIYGPYDNVHPCDIFYCEIFFPDSSKYGLRYKKDDKWYVQLNDKIYGPYDNVHPCDIFYCEIFFPDSSKYGWSYTKDDKYYVQINDKIYGPYDEVDFTINKDNKAIIAYILGDEIVVEEIE